MIAGPRSSKPLDSRISGEGMLQCPTNSAVFVKNGHCCSLLFQIEYGRAMYNKASSRYVEFVFITRRYRGCGVWERPGSALLTLICLYLCSVGDRAA
jgi:hypothetical protein